MMPKNTSSAYSPTPPNIFRDDTSPRSDSWSRTNRSNEAAERSERAGFMICSSGLPPRIRSRARPDERPRVRKAYLHRRPQRLQQLHQPINPCIIVSCGDRAPFRQRAIDEDQGNLGRAQGVGHELRNACDRLVVADQRTIDFRRDEPVISGDQLERCVRLPAIIEHRCEGGKEGVHAKPVLAAPEIPADGRSPALSAPSTRRTSPDRVWQPAVARGC